MVSYSQNINSISKHSNGVINTKAQVFIADMRVNKNLWLEAIKISAYLAN